MWPSRGRQHGCLDIPDRGGPLSLRPFGFPCNLMEYGKSQGIPGSLPIAPVRGRRHSLLPRRGLRSLETLLSSHTKAPFTSFPMAPCCLPVQSTSPFCEQKLQADCRKISLSRRGFPSRVFGPAWPVSFDTRSTRHANDYVPLLAPDFPA